MVVRNQYIEMGLLVFLAFLWGSSFTLIKVAVETVPPATIVLARLLLGSILPMGLVRLRSIALPSLFKNPHLWCAFFIQGLLQSALPFTLISWGEKHIDSGLAGLLNSTPPLFAFIITFFILKQGDSPLRNFIGVITGLLGVLVTIGPDVLEGSNNSVWGQIAVIGSSVSYAMAAIYARRFSEYPVLLTAACSMAMATVLMLPISVVVDQPWTLAPSVTAIKAIVCLGVLSTALAMIIYFRLVKTLGVAGVTSGSYLRAGFSILLGAVFLGENLSVSLLIGLVLIFVSVAIMTGHIRLPVMGKSSN